MCKAQLAEERALQLAEEKIDTAITYSEFRYGGFEHAVAKKAIRLIASALVAEQDVEPYAAIEQACQMVRDLEK